MFVPYSLAETPYPREVIGGIAERTKGDGIRAAPHAGGVQQPRHTWVTDNGLGLQWIGEQHPALVARVGQNALSVCDMGDSHIHLILRGFQAAAPVHRVHYTTPPRRAFHPPRELASCARASNEGGFQRTRDSWRLYSASRIKGSIRTWHHRSPDGAILSRQKTMCRHQLTPTGRASPLILRSSKRRSPWRGRDHPSNLPRLHSQQENGTFSSH